jgi:hypothetical protein
MGTYHRLIKGTNDLKIKLKKLYQTEVWIGLWKINFRT